MQNYVQARKNMLDCQLAPNGIVMPDILEVFNKVPRERFLPENRQGTAYLDEDLLLDEGCFCMEPVVHARMVQAATPDEEHSVLNIGDVTGYSSAILSDLVSTVVTLESTAGTLERARSIWDELDYCNIAVVKGTEKQGIKKHAPYDLIFINGAVAEIPDKLLEQLDSKGRLVAVVKKPGETVGRITVVEKDDNGKFSTGILFDASTPYASGFEPVPAFAF